MIHNTWRADDDSPQVGGDRRGNRGGKLCRPFGSGRGSAELDVPHVVVVKTERHEGGTGVCHAELNGEKPRAGAVEADKIGGPAHLRGHFRWFHRLEDVLIDQMINDFPRCYRAHADSFGKLGA